MKSTPNNVWSRRGLRLLACVSLASIASVTGATAANAASRSGETGVSTAAASRSSRGNHSSARRGTTSKRCNGETVVTGADAEAASAAALEAVPGGTVKRVTTDTDDGGAFEVHMTDADGNRVKVILDAEFGFVKTITGGSGHGHGNNGETVVTGADAEAASAAALEAVPGGTVKRVTTDTDDGGAFEVHMTDADGNRVKVVLDAEFGLVKTIAGGSGHGHGNGRGHGYGRRRR